MPYTSLSVAELISQCASSPLPLPLQRAKIFTFDTVEFPFRECVASVLGVNKEDLPCLHTTKEGEAVLAQSNKAGRLKRRKDYYVKVWRSAKTGKKEDRLKFDSVLDRFVETFVAPRMSEEGELGVEESLPDVAYQRDAILRVVLPGGQTTTHLHCDADYHHPPSEVNWWLPLTPVSGTNSLYLESHPGKGDFQAVELEYGQVLRFYGNLCQHYTEHNVSNTTRVSFDMRVISLTHHKEEWRDSMGRPCIYRVGHYYLRPGQGGEVKEVGEKELNPG